MVDLSFFLTVTLSRLQIGYIFLFFPENNFDISCKLSPKKTSCMNCQSLFSGKKKRYISQNVVCWFFFLPRVPASVAQLDVHLTGDQEVGVRPPRVSILSWRFDHEIFSTVILSLQLIQEGQLSVSCERMCTILVNRLKVQACPVNVWLGKLTMIPLGCLGCKTSTQTKFTQSAMC